MSTTKKDPETEDIDVKKLENNEPEQPEPEDPWENTAYAIAEEQDKKSGTKEKTGETDGAETKEKKTEPKPESKDKKEAADQKTKSGDKDLPEAPTATDTGAKDKGPAAEEKIVSELEKLPKLEGEELKRAHYLQDTLKNLSAIFIEPKLGADAETLKPEEKADKIRQQVEEMKAQLQREKDAGVFGPASQEAYKQYINWLQKAVPETIRELDTLQLAIPPGSPIPLESDRQGRAIDPQLYKALAADERLALELKLDEGKLPTDGQLDKLDSVYSWLARANESVAANRDKQRDAMIDHLIDKNGLPESWRFKEGDDPLSRRNSAEEMIDLSLRTRNYIEAMQSLYKSSKYGDFPMELPRGAELVVEHHGKSHVIKDNELNSPHNRFLLKEGKIQEVRLDLPKDLRQEEPANKDKIQSMRSWLDKHGEKIDQAIGELLKLQENPDAVIMFGDQELANGKGLFNANGEFVAIVSGKYTPKNGESVRDVNLIGYDFQVEEVKEGPNAGKIRVTQTITAENAPWYAYQNIRAFGIEQVGKPMKVDEKFVDPDDFVPVRSGDRIQMVKAKNLQSFKEMQQFAYYGEKALTITMDAAMLVSGTIEVGAAIKGARLAATGAQAALKMGMREALWEGGKGALRVTVAGAGIFNNAGARSTEWGRTINTARGIYFLGDIGLGLASSGWGLFKAGKAAEAMNSAQKVHTIIRGREAINGAEAIKGIPWVKEIHKGTEFAFKATEYGFAPVIIGDLKHQIGAIAERGKRDPAKDAIIQVGDGRGLQKAEKGAFDPNDAKALQAARQVMDSYKDVLTAGRPKESADEIKAIFDKTKDLMGPEKTEQERAAYRQELIKKLSFTEDEIKQLEHAHPYSVDSKEFRLSQQQIADLLLDPEKRKEFPASVAKLAEKFLSEKDKDVQAAARIAMLYLSRDSDGKIKTQEDKTQLEIPEYKRKIWHEGAGENPGWEEEVTIPARKVDIAISGVDNIHELQRDLTSTQLGNRGIATGEVLTRLGAITHREYAGVLQNVLADPNASREDKLRALSDSYGPRMAAIIDGLRYQESLEQDSDSKLSRDRLLGKSHGLTAPALMKQLESTAINDKDPDVRAMAASILYGLKEKHLERRNELLSGFAGMLDDSRSKPGEFASMAKDRLKKDMLAAIPEEPAELADRIRDSKLNAAESLAAMSDKKDAALQSEITKAIAASFSTSDLSTANRVIGLLLPERIKQLEKDNPQLANEIRQAAVNLVKKPGSYGQEAETVKLLSQLEPLLKDADPELKRQLQGKLHDLLRASEFNQNYARHYPDLRAAAIDSLAALGSRESLNIIRSHASAEASLKIAGQVLPAGEQDARVRLAAVRALETLQDQHLRVVMNQLVDKETDPSVASYLRDVRFTQQRIEPDSREWKELYEKTRTDIIGFGKKYPYLDTFTHDASKQWLKENFDLLDYDTFKTRSKSAVDNATSWLWRRFSLEATINHEEWKKAKEINDQRTKQWESLVEMSKQGGADGNKAKMALYYIATQDGSILGSQSGLEAGAIQGYYDSNHYHKFYQSDWKSSAAHALKELAESNCEGKDVVAKCIKDALTANINVPGYVSVDFLDGLRALGTKDKNGYAVPREELARVTAEALKLETRRIKGNQTDYFQDDLIKDLEKYGHRMVLPVLQAMVDEPGHIQDSVRKKAQDMIDNFMHNTELMWKETRADSTSSSQERADRLRKALEERNNAEQTTQEIFNAYKDYKIKDAKDPGLVQLQLAMNDTNERVRLAASRVLMNSELPNTHPVKLKAIASLTEMAISGAHPAYQKEAHSLLSTLQTNEPILLASNNKFYKIEKEGGKVKATEYSKQPWQDKPQQSGYLAPDGSSMSWKMNKQGDLTEVFKDGKQWQRTMEGDKASSQWTNPRTGEKFKGDFPLPESEKPRQEATRAAFQLESRLAQAKSNQDRINAIKELASKPPITLADDRRIGMLDDLLKSDQEEVRLEAAGAILAGEKSRFTNSAFSDEARQSARETIEASADQLIEKALSGKDSAATALLQKAIESPGPSNARSQLLTAYQNRTQGWQQADAMLRSAIGNAKVKDTLPDGSLREARVTKEGLVISERKDGTLTKLSTPDGVKYADLLLSDLSSAGTAQEKLEIAKTILQSKLDTGASEQHRQAALKELVALAAKAELPADQRLEAAKAFFQSAAETAEGSDKVSRALAELTQTPATRAAATALMLSLPKADALKAIDALKQQALKDGGDLKNKISAAMPMLEKWKAEPAAEAAAYELYAKARSLEDQNLARKIAALVDRTGPDSGLSPLSGKDDPRIKAMSQAVESDDYDSVNLSAALALSDQSSKDIPQQSAENARIHLHQYISQKLSELNSKESAAGAEKPTDADWAKLDHLLEKIGQSKDDFSRLYIETKRLELKGDYAGLQTAYEKLADISKDRESPTAEKLYRQKAKEAAELADPKIASALKDLKTSISLSKSEDIEKAAAALEKLTGDKSPALANAYADIARYYKANGDFNNAQIAAAKASKIMDELAREQLTQMQPQAFSGQSTESALGSKKLASSPYEGSGGSVKLKDNSLLKDTLDYQVSRAVVGVNAGDSAKTQAAASVSLNTELFGSDSPQTLLAQENLADVLKDSGDARAASEIYEANLNHPSSFGPERGRLTAKLAQSLVFLGPEDTNRAVQLMEDSLEKMQMEGVPPSMIAAQMNEYAQIMNKRGDDGKARDLMQRAQVLQTTGKLPPATTMGHYAGYGSYGAGPGGPIGFGPSGPNP